MDFANAFGRRAFRRPVTDRGSRDPDGGVHGGPDRRQLRRGDRGDDPRGAAVGALPLSAGDDGARQRERRSWCRSASYELASRLSFLIWAAGPDDALLDAAGRGELADETAVAAKARAMLADPKARVAITDFYNQWIGTSRLDITTKSRDAVPGLLGRRARRDEGGDARVRAVRALDGRPQAGDAADLAGRVRVQRARADLRRHRAGRHDDAADDDAARGAGAGGHPDAGRRSWRCRPTPIRRRRCCAGSSCAPS